MKPIFPSDAPALRLSLPALLALALAVGCGTLALAQTVALPSFTPLIWEAWAVAVAFCVANRAVTQRVCRSQSTAETRDGTWMLWALMQWLAWSAALTLCVLPPLTVMGGFTFLVPPDVLTDDNMKVAVFVGWVCIGIVFLAGASTGSARPTLSTQGRSALLGEAPVPLAVPLLPTLSLFGLLNIVTVDTPVMIAFFVFLAASLYLVGYENYLDQLLNQRRALQASGAATAHLASSGRASTRSSARRSPATQYLAICAVWFVTFSAAAAAFYYPLNAVLPRASLALELNRRAAQQTRASTDDWRAPGRGFSLRGGNYTLSSEEIARVETFGSSPSSLWRGRIYEDYLSGADAFEGNEEAASRWDVADAENTARWHDNDGGRIDMLALHDDLLQRFHLENMADAKNLDYSMAWSRVQPLTQGVDGLAPVLLSLGQPTAAHGTFAQIAVRPDGTARLSGSTGRSSFFSTRRRRGNDAIGFANGNSSSTYEVRSRVPQPNLVTLHHAPGLNNAQLKQWRANSITAASLQVPSNRATRDGFATIVATIAARERDAGRPMKTPAQRADAIARYLTETCEYSLNVPLIPPTRDAALFFMTSSKRGACDMFASSMTLLLRTMNVPARLATGYVQPDIPDAMGNGNSYTLRGTDAHAWVEYFVPRIGWMTFDPTEGTRLADESLSAQVGALLHFPAQWKSFVVPVIIAALVLLLVTCGVGVPLIFARRRARERKNASPTDAITQERARIRAAYARARGLLMAHGALPDGVSARTLTPRELENAVLAQPLEHDAKTEFAALTYLFDLASYAPSLPVAGADQTQLQASLARLKKALHQKRK